MAADINLEVDLLRAFVAVADVGSFTAAASFIARSQSAVSQKILRLEEIMGQPVFVRTNRALELTRTGEQLLGYAREVIKNNDAFLAKLHEESTTHGVVRLGVSDNLIPTQLIKLVSDFLDEAPQIQLELSTGTSHELLDQYEKNMLDALIVRRRDDMPRTGRIVWQEPLVWMAAPGYKIAPGTPVRLVVMRQPCNYHDLMINALSSTQRTWTTACIASSLIGVVTSVSAGMGIPHLAVHFLARSFSP